MKAKNRKKYFRRIIKLLQNKFCSRNLIKRINTWAVSLIRYSMPFFDWTWKKLKNMGYRKRKLRIMRKALYLRNDTDRFFSTMKGESGIASLMECVDTNQRFREYTKSKYRFIIVAANNCKYNNTWCIQYVSFLYRHLKLTYTFENSVCYCYTSYEMTDQFLWFQVQMNSYSKNWNTPY